MWSHCPLKFLSETWASSFYISYAFTTFNLLPSHINSTFYIPLTYTHFISFLYYHSLSQGLLPQSFHLFLYFKFYSLLTHYPTCSQVIFLKYKSNQWCCSSTLKIFIGFQCSSISSRIQTCGALSGPGRRAGPNPWEDQPLGNKVAPTHFTIHHSQPLTPAAEGDGYVFGSLYWSSKLILL